ncbi:hypothetical protein FKN01_05170 [Streptomyces sp. 130]|uniref:hypothetical protein n=1 Tax=Streptomyces sp. 130 TaxID=2591006 RepID=UPI00117CDC62|nr:hypothetical protein [Streptomyces sp. 130]TRV80674.1 hypothetical protein FKN01_05170 [Streptomyces sp. 130]
MYDWEQIDLGDTRIAEERAELISPQSEIEAVRAFRSLLHSTEADASYIALSYYHYCASMSRHGGENILVEYAGEVLECARRVLSTPSSKYTPESPREDGDNHAAALYAIATIAQLEDSRLVCKALNESHSEGVVTGAAQAASTILENNPDNQTEEHTLGALTEALAGVMVDDSLVISARWAAINAIARSHRADAESYLTQALELENIELQAVAALALADRDVEKYRTLIERRMASWPDDPPFPADRLPDVMG